MKFPWTFEGDPEVSYKRFIVGVNVRGVVRFIKPTSNTARCENDPEQLKGVVFYQAGEVNCFPEKTVIDPASKTFDIPHSYLRQCNLNGTLEYIGKLPEDFREKVIRAVLNNVRMRKVEKGLLLPLVWQTDRYGGLASTRLPQFLDRPKHRSQPETGTSRQLRWPLPEDLSDQKLDELLFGKRSAPGVRVNCGGAAFTDPSGKYWQADTGRNSRVNPVRHYGSRHP